MPSLAAAALRAYLRYGPALLGNAALADRLDRHYRQTATTAVAETTFGALIPVTTTDVIQRYLYLFGEWEPHLTALVRHRLCPGDTFIDVGANIGYYTLLASRLVGPTSRVVAVEPCPDFYQDLVDNARRNGCANVRTVQGAAADRVGTLTLYRETTANLGNTSAVRPRGTVAASFDVCAAPLSAIATAEELASARLIKIDAEGGEAAILRDLPPHLGQLRPDAEILVEVTPRSLAKLGESVHDVFEPLLAAGFHATRIVNDYSPHTYPAALRAPQPPQPLGLPVTAMTDVLFSRTYRPLSLA